METVAEQLGAAIKGRRFEHDASVERLAEAHARGKEVRESNSRTALVKKTHQASPQHRFLTFETFFFTLRAGKRWLKLFPQQKYQSLPHMDGNGRPQGEEPCAVTTVQMFRQDVRRGKAALRTLEINVMAKRMTPQKKSSL